MATSTNNIPGRNLSRRKPTGPNPKAVESRKNINVISGSELKDILAPITIESFTTEYCDRKPLLIKGSKGKLASLFQGEFGFEDFCRAAHQQKVNIYAGKSQGLLPMGFDRQKPFSAIQPGQVEAAFAAGANISIQDISEQRLAVVAAAIKAQLHHPGDVSVYASLSPRGEGRSPHIDRSSAMFIQCEGSKRYLISPEPVLLWPSGSASFSSDGAGKYFDHDPDPWEEIEGVDLASLTEIVTEPGDVLYIPAGTIHATQAISEYTLNVNILFSHAKFLDLLSRVLEQMLSSNPAWRHLPQINCASATPGELPPEAEEFFAARLEELRALFNTLTPGAFELNREWQRLVADPGEATSANLSLGCAEQSDSPIRRKDVLRISRKAPVTYAIGTNSDSETDIYLYFGKKEVSVAGEWTPFLKSMVDKQRFRAESATRWAGESKRYPWEMVKEYLEALLAQGFLEREDA